MKVAVESNILAYSLNNCLLALSINIRVGRKWLSVTNALAYTVLATLEDCRGLLLASLRNIRLE